MWQDVCGLEMANLRSLARHDVDTSLRLGLLEKTATVLPLLANSSLKINVFSNHLRTDSDMIL